MGEFAVRLMFKEKTYLKPSKVLGQKKRKKWALGGMASWLWILYVWLFLFGGWLWLMVGNGGGK